MEISTNGRLLNLDSPVVMGIINVNNDSFHSGSRVSLGQELIDKAGKMISDGASIVDVGAVSTRPGASPIDVEEELSLVVPAIITLRSEFPEVFLSVDTYSGAVVRACAEAGVDIINDVSAGSLDDDMLKSVADVRLPYILMHMAGTPQTMQDNPNYENVTLELLIWLKNKSYELKSLDINEIIIDPGFGFGKTIQHNYTLLRELEVFKILGYPILTGISRKSMLHKLLNIKASEALNATTVANTLSLMQGANILRVHDVKPAMEAIKVYDAFKG